MFMAKSNVVPWSNYLDNYETSLSETYLQWWIYKECPKMLRNIDIVLRNIYLWKSEDYFQYLLKYVLKMFNHQWPVYAITKASSCPFIKLN